MDRFRLDNPNNSCKPGVPVQAILTGEEKTATPDSSNFSETKAIAKTIRSRDAVGVDGGFSINYADSQTRDVIRVDPAAKGIMSTSDLRPARIRITSSQVALVQVPQRNQSNPS